MHGINSTPRSAKQATHSTAHKLGLSTASAKTTRAVVEVVEVVEGAEAVAVEAVTLQLNLNSLGCPSYLESSGWGC